MLCCWVAHDIAAECVNRLPLPGVFQEEEPIAGISVDEGLNLGQLRQEGEATINVEGHGSRQKVDEI